MPGVSGISFISMDGGEDWIFRPVMRNMMKAESLIDGTVDLQFIGLLNEALDVEAENQYRIRKKMEK